MTGGTLATWDTSVITQAGFYNIALTVNGVTTEQAFTTVYLEPDLLSTAWPVFVDLGPYFNSGVLPAQNPDGSLRLVMESPNQGTVLAASWVFNLDGSFQKTNLDQFGSDHQPAVGNVDGLSGDESVVADFNQIRVIHPDNSFDIFTPGVDVDMTRVPLLLEDLNNDFQLESVTVGSDFSTQTAYVFAWQPNGQQAPGFPLQVQDQNSLNSWFNHTRVLVGDLDGDGTKEVLVQEGITPSDYVLRLFGHDGAPKPFNAPVLTGIPFAMIAADLDHNGKLETILVNYNGPQVLLHVFQPDGTERPGWPVDVSLQNQQFTQSFLAVADFNRDGHEEIVLSRDAALYVFNSDGTLFPGAWPLRSGFFGFGSVVIGDVDGDGFPEIITSRADFSLGGLKLLAVHSNGTIMKTWELTGSNGFSSFLYPGPALLDFDQNGTTDIAVAYQLSGGSTIPGVVTVLDTHSAFVPANNDWPFMLQNQRSNPVLLRPSPASVEVSLSSGTNPSIIGNTLAFTATVSPAPAGGSVQFFDGAVPLSGAVVLNNGSASISTTDLGLGAHTITAHYTGDNLHSASVSPALAVSVIKGNASISLILMAGANPSLAGDSLTFTAQVAPTTATGSITFFDGDTQISGDIPLARGSASLSISTLAVGPHSITAHYSGDARFGAAISAVFLQIVNSPKANPSVVVVLTAGTNPSTFGDSLTLAANVGPATATGTVIFLDNGSPISGSIALNGGTASFSTAALGAGAHSITAQYSGDANLNPGKSAALIQNVAKARTTVTLELAERDTSFKPGTPLTFVATINPAAATGTVVFLDGTTPISGAVPVNNGVATFTTSLASGTHAISAQYNGDANFNASSSPQHKVKIK